ncbi:MAG: hypothetical protein V1898_03230 [Patescibacteria group bacterium]
MKCKICQQVFNKDERDLLPCNYCPNCRVRNLLSYRNERSLHKRKCDLCHEDLISTYRPDAPFKVYCNHCWWSDKWSEPGSFKKRDQGGDGLDYATDYDKNKDFISQFKQLFFKIPHLGMNVTNSVNCDFTNYSDKNKDCFLLINALADENVYYSERMFFSKDCVDCNGLTNCQLCFWCTSCRDCYYTRWSEFCEGCTDLDFCYDCKGCQNCFGSFGLRNKQYVYFNEQLTEKEYKQKTEGEHTYSRLHDLKIRVYSHWLKYPHRFANIKISENTTGDNVTRAKNCEYIFDADEMENCRHCYVGIRAKDSQYCVPADEAERCFNNMSTWKSYNVNCSLGCWYSSDILYSYNCMSCSNCLGCASLNKKKFCILNKQYSEYEYRKLEKIIIEKLKQQNVYGDFFPVEFCMFPYNDSIAYEYYPLKKEEAISLGYKWAELEEKIINLKLPVCNSCGQNYRIIKQEKDLYKRMNLPEPQACPKCRYQNRSKRRNARKLYNRECAKCKKSIASSYEPDRPEIIYCNECYQEEIY